MKKLLTCLLAIQTILFIAPPLAVAAEGETASFSGSEQQKVTIKGTIVDGAGIPVIGAVVMENGSNARQSIISSPRRRPSKELSGLISLRKTAPSN